MAKPHSSQQWPCLDRERSVSALWALFLQSERSFFRSLGIESAHEGARELDDFLKWAVWALTRALTVYRHGQWISNAHDQRQRLSIGVRIFDQRPCFHTITESLLTIAFYWRGNGLAVKPMSRNPEGRGSISRLGSRAGRRSSALSTLNYCVVLPRWFCAVAG